MIILKKLNKTNGSWTMSKQRPPQIKSSCIISNYFLLKLGRVN
jgi:hypothetical protein